jgi:hypothetical protein
MATQISLMIRGLYTHATWLAFRTFIAAQGLQAPKVVERLSFDWDHSGKPTNFALYFQNRNDGMGDADRLVIQAKNRQPWILINRDDEWGPGVADDLPSSEKKNLVSSKRLFFVSIGQVSGARSYLVLKGAGYGCCVGSLTVLTPAKDGTPKVVFHAPEHLLREIVPLPDETGVALIGQPSDAEARSTKDSESYDPYRVYVIRGDIPARYDLAKSKDYTIKNYCEWAGPEYNERFVAVNVDSGQYGAGHCRTMTENQFDAYRKKHPAQFQ